MGFDQKSNPGYCQGSRDLKMKQRISLSKLLLRPQEDQRSHARVLFSNTEGPLKRLMVLLTDPLIEIVVLQRSQPRLKGRKSLFQDL